ncbi:hypothetical protein CYFUS_002150 [Cystobacter fuscus]|uniref:Uncharacterized protein n=1 Tax=Cystobacter fuscus TaxID=43 RepID=A0A250IYB5_9BACT|nr:hypothetical protein [Cystobacter fuscus]ATB36735.1 hypothetical protein CYFUS_002150 [Cystobacter fuscus]
MARRVYLLLLWIDWNRDGLRRVRHWRLEPHLLLRQLLLIRHLRLLLRQLLLIRHLRLLLRRILPSEPGSRIA